MATLEDFAHIKVKKLLSMERKYPSLHWKFKSGNGLMEEGLYCCLGHQTIATGQHS
jgi:hypothetical protein